MYSAKATIEIEDGRLTIEGSDGFVNQMVGLYTLPARKSIDSAEGAATYKTVSASDLIAEKRPKGHHEIVAVFAFLLYEQGVEEFSEEDIRRMYLRARVRPPKVVGQALRDAKSKFDYIDNGAKRGTYKLSHHGDRTVRFDLPRPGM